MCLINVCVCNTQFVYVYPLKYILISLKTCILGVVNRESLNECLRGSLKEGKLGIKRRLERGLKP